MVCLCTLLEPAINACAFPVRNRSRELVELLSDVEKIRAERRKAKANKSKYVGTGNDGMSFSSDGGRYGGFGNDNQSYVIASGKD